MLLAVDVGNTNVLIGLYEGARLRAHWRLQTHKRRTVDEHKVLMEQLFNLEGVDRESINHGVLACVVPPLQDVMVELMADYVGLNPLVVGPGIKTGMAIKLDNPREVGADRVVNAVAAYEEARGACVVVDFGTATTFDVISKQGEYLGGAIAPGLHISADALYRNTAKLPRVPVMRPRGVVGRSTVESIQSGLVFGYVGLVDGILERTIKEMGFVAHRVFATGGLARLISGCSKYIHDVDDFLTLKGLRILYEKNRCGEKPEGDAAEKTE